MKKYLLFGFFVLCAARLGAQSVTSSYASDQTITIPSSSYDIRFSVAWFADDYPMNSAPGRIDLLSGGTLVGRVVASNYRGSSASISVSGGGTVDNVSTWVNIYTPSGAPGDGFLYGTWHLTGLTPGTYTVRAWTYQTADRLYHASTVWTETSFDDGYSPEPPNQAPTISWISAPNDAGNGAGYYVAARAHDADGNLVQVNVWKNGAPFAFAGGGNGTDGDSGNWTSDGGPQNVTFTAQAVDAAGATSAVISHTVSIAGAVNQPPSVMLVAPGAQTIVAGTTLTITSRATDPDGNLSNHNLDIQRPDGAWNYETGFATGEPYQGGPIGSAGDSTRSANFNFTDVGTYYVRSAASDGSGWYHSSTVAITVVAPPPVQHTLATSASAGGSVSPGGTYNAGTLASVSAFPDGTHDFAGWSGDAAGSSNPVAVTMDRAKTVVAIFAPKSFSLVTAANGGGSVTPGGNYPYGTTVTINAAADTTHRFVGWTGDASGTTPSIALTLTRPLAVQAVFESKTVQTITLPPIGDQAVGASIPLTVTSSSGLPVTISVSGPATFSSGALTITGPGSVTVQATQAGDGYYLPAAPVTRSFNAAAPALVRYRAAGRTFLQTGRAPESIPYVIQPNP